MKEALKGYLAVLQHDVLDLGTHSTAPVDYPDYAEAVGITPCVAEKSSGASWFVVAAWAPR